MLFVCVAGFRGIDVRRVFMRLVNVCMIYDETDIIVNIKCTDHSLLLRSCFCICLEVWWEKGRKYRDASSRINIRIDWTWEPKQLSQYDNQVSG
jgi:hypothetical protein